MSHSLERNEVFTPSRAESELAKISSETLASHLSHNALIRFQIGDAKTPSEIVLPASIAHLLQGILAEFAKGNAVAVAPVQTELTTTQAAELLHVSRPYLMKLLEAGEIPFHKTGTHHRLRLTDVLTFKKELAAKRQSALDELSTLDQELGLS